MSRIRILTALTIVATTGSTVLAQSSFTYQGQVKLDGAPVTDSVDLLFRVYDADVDGSVVGTPMEMLGVEVANGLFSVELDFGDELFTGDDRWVEVSIRIADGGESYETLTNRQKLTAAPYAHFALRDPRWESSNDAITNKDSAFVGINRDYPIGSEYFGVHAPIESGYGGMYISTDGENGRPFYGYYNGTDVAWHYLDGASGDWRLSLGGVDRVYVDNTGKVGIGNSSPGALLHVGGNYTPTVSQSVARIGGVLAAEETIVSDGGQILSRSPGGSRAASMEVDSTNDTDGAAWYMVSHADNSPFGLDNGMFSLYHDSANHLVIDTDGNVGIGTTLPATRLQVSTGTDVGSATGAFIQIGSDNGANIGIDTNEIMARENGAVADLYLQNEGGNVLIGPADPARLGIGLTDPLTPVHVRNANLSVDAAALESEDVVVESNDAAMALVSSAGGSWGSILSLKEVSGGALVDHWSIGRRTTAGGRDLRFSYGSDAGPGANAVVMNIETNGQVSISDTIELFATEGGSDGAQVRMRDAAGVATYEMDCEENGGGSVQFMRNSANEVTIELDADESDHGAIYIDRSDGSNRIQLRSEVSSAGWISTRGSNGEYNVVLTRENASSNHGWIDVSDASGNPQAGAYVNSSGNGVIWGDTKNFRIPHPRDPQSDIWYACVEGPEAAAYVRGVATLVDGAVTVQLPDHFQDVAIANGMTVQLTPRSADSKGLAVVSRSVTEFEVRELMNGNGSYEFDWEVKAVRRGHENFRVIRSKNEIRRMAEPAPTESESD